LSAYILVVEDEPDISALVAYHLARESYRVRTAGDGTEALRIIEREPPDLIVLDMMLPHASGLDVLREIRRRPEIASLPVILLTSRGEEQHRIEGLGTGADDHLAKPFSPRELVLRVAAVLKRVRQQPRSAAGGRLLSVGPVTIDTGTSSARVAGQPLDLTPTEYRLLSTLVERQGSVQSRRQLLEAVWHTTADITTRTVDMHVRRLRGKLGAAAAWVETVRGLGYRFRTEPPES
jgi:two-component system, OmpR family, phosphate regulon response regulator PhoB